MNGLQGFWLHHHNHLGGGIMTAFDFPSTATAWLPTSLAVQLLGKVQEVSDYTTMISTDAQVLKLTLVVKLWVL